MTDQDIIDRLDRGQARFGMIDEKLRVAAENDAAILAALDKLTASVASLEAKVEQTHDVVEAWRSAKLMGRWARHLGNFAKWALGFFVAAAGAVAIWKEWWVK